MFSARLRLTLCDTTCRIDGSKNDDEEATSTPVCHPSNKTTKDHRRAKACHEELSNLDLSKSIIRVQSIDVRTLQPITESRGEVDEEIPFEQTSMGLSNLVG